MLVARDLWKSYGTTAAVAGVSLEVRAGEIVGLLGPNGAGKSTTVGMLCGLTPPDRGTVTIDGVEIAGAATDGDSAAVKKRLGVVPQDIALHEELPAIENLKLFGALYGFSGRDLHDRAGAALELVGLADRRRAKPSSFSGGMKRRLNMACALVHDPDILLLDEPTVGIDPQSRNAIFDNLESLRARGKALLYTTHYMEEVERLCDRIVIIDHGRVIAADTLEALLELAPPVEVVVRAPRPSLESVFLHLTGRQLRDGQ